MEADNVEMEVQEDLKVLSSEPPTSDCDKKFKAHCTHCNRVFYSERSIRCHLKIHNEKTLKCSTCPLMFNRLDTLFFHVSDHYIAKTKSMDCHVEGCGMTVSSIFEGEQHACDEHMVDGQVVLKCETCGKNSQTFRKFFAHYILKHGDLKQYVDETTIKQKQFLAKKKSEKKISNYIKLKNSPVPLPHDNEIPTKPVEASSDKESGPIQDPKLDKTKTEELEEPLGLKNVNEQEKEMLTRLKNAITPMNGESSSEMLEKLSSFVATVFPNDEESFYQCPHCGLGFMDSILWMTHLSFHDNEDPFKCSSCSRKFENRQSFVIHLTYFSHGGKDED